MTKLKKVSIRQSVLTAIGYLLPLVVAAGLLIAIGNLCGGQNVTKLEGMTVPDALTTVGVFGMGLIPSFIGQVLHQASLWGRLLLSWELASSEVWLAALWLVTLLFCLRLI